MTAALKAPEKPRRATYADIEAVPPGKVAELIGGQLYVFPRPRRSTPTRSRFSAQS